MDIAQILPSLFIGSHPRSVEEIELLRCQHGVTAVLNLQTDAEMAAASLVWQPLEAHYKRSCVHLVRLPMVETQDEMRAKLSHGVRTLDDLLGGEHTVFVHCREGIGRSPTVAIGYLGWGAGWGLNRAVAHVTKVHQKCSPHLDALRYAMRTHAASLGARKA